MSDIFRIQWAQLADLPAAARGPKQGEYVDALVAEQALPANTAFRGGAALVPEPDPLPAKTLPGGFRLTLLSPMVAGLEHLADAWEQTLQDVGLEPGNHDQALEPLDRLKQYRPLARGAEGEAPDRADFGSDDSAANGSSLAVLAEFGGRRLLLTGDAHADVLAASLARWRAQHGGGRVALDAFKLSHHGSRGCSSRGLLRQLACRRHLVSTSGTRYQHPHPETLDLVLAEHDPSAGPPELCFNHHREATAPWLDARRQAERGYAARFAQAPIDLLQP